MLDFFLICMGHKMPIMAFKISPPLQFTQTIFFLTDFSTLLYTSTYYIHVFIPPLSSLTAVSSVLLPPLSPLTAVFPLSALMFVYVFFPLAPSSLNAFSLCSLSLLTHFPPKVSFLLFSMFPSPLTVFFFLCALPLLQFLSPYPLLILDSL